MEFPATYAVELYACLEIRRRLANIPYQQQLTSFVRQQTDYVKKREVSSISRGGGRRIKTFIHSND